MISEKLLKIKRTADDTLLLRCGFGYCVHSIKNRNQLLSNSVNDQTVNNSMLIKGPFLFAYQNLTGHGS